MRKGNLPTVLAGVALIVTVVIPLLALVPFGWLWLWQNGYVFHWLGGALAISIIAFSIRLWLLRRVKSLLKQPPGAAPDDGRSPREIAAWSAVEALAAATDPARISSRDALMALGVETVEAVAREMHPGEEDPAWKFTLTEALLLTENVSRRLRQLMLETIPLSDQLTVRQMWRLYRWRSAIDVAEKAYDVWRLIRLTNPWVAVTQEVRERLGKVVYEDLRSELARRLAAAYVREVGRCAIDLYSGRLRLTPDEIATRVSSHTERDREAPAMMEPIRILIAGQVGAGKSSLVNALAADIHAGADVLPTTRDFQGYELKREGMPSIMLVDSPGIETGNDTRLAAAAEASDLVIWVAAANRPDRALDIAALEAVRQTFARHIERRMPPFVLVLTHVDRLRPFQEWNPPYDLQAAATEKARSIRAALEAASADLRIDATDAVPVSLARHAPLYNVDVLWAKLVATLPEAKGAQLLRTLAEARTGFDWRRLLTQAKGAGRLVVGAVVDRALRGKSKAP